MVIVAAVDRSDRQASIVEQAAKIADAFNEPLHAVHVLSRSEFVELGRTSVDQDEPIDMDRIRKVSADIAADAATELHIEYEAIGLVGSPASRIVDYADDQNAEYIVISGRK